MLQKIKKNIILTILLMGLGFVLVACGADSPTPTETAQPNPTETAVGEQLATPTTLSESGGTIIGEATVTDLQANVISTTPVQVQLIARGDLPDGCTEITGVQQQRNGETFMVTILTQRPADLNCTQQIVPFEETFMLENAAELTENVYTVNANGATVQFELELSSLPETNSPLTASVSPNSGSASSTVQLTAAGFPANTAVEIGFGPVDSEYTVIGNAQTDNAGQLTTNVTVPATATAGDWVFVVVSGGQDAVTNPFTVSTATTAATPTTVSPQGNRVYIYLVALEDGGQSGELIGCNDSLIPVEITIEPTIAPLTAALNQLFAIDEQMYGQSGLYNALYNSNLSIAGINIVNRQATIDLRGDLSVGGVCDEPRVEAQIRATALQFSTIDAVVILFNGVPLDEYFSGQG